MKTSLLIVFGAMLTLTCTVASATEAPKAPSPRVGVYDSRVLSFAHFWSEPARQEREALIASARAARAASDDVRFTELNARLVAAQKRSHLQVFSTMPADEAMAALTDKLPEIRRALGVARLVSIWDEPSLRGVAEADRIDATDRLLRELLPNPSEKQRKTIAGMRKMKPLPLAEATRLADAGRL